MLLNKLDHLLADCPFPSQEGVSTNGDLLKLYSASLIEIERCSGDKRSIRYYIQEQSK